MPLDPRSEKLLPSMRVESEAAGGLEDAESATM
jgi:hypothetical protein